MNMFASIMSKIFHHPAATGPDADTSHVSDTAEKPGGTPFDVDGALADMASKHGEAANYKMSIVDLLRVLDLDSSLDARKRLAEELGVHAGADGSAEENVALHKAVMQKLAENGGKVAGFGA